VHVHGLRMHACDVLVAVAHVLHARSMASGRGPPGGMVPLNVLVSGMSAPSIVARDVDLSHVRALCQHEEVVVALRSCLWSCSAHHEVLLRRQRWTMVPLAPSMAVRSSEQGVKLLKHRARLRLPQASCT
jgi:hypothetical protein